MSTVLTILILPFLLLTFYIIGLFIISDEFEYDESKTFLIFIRIMAGFVTMIIGCFVIYVLLIVSSSLAILILEYFK